MTVRRTGWMLAILVLLFTGLAGLSNAIREYGDARGAWQMSVHAAVALYGVCGVAAGVGLALKRRWSVLMAMAWAAGTIWAATVASVAYSPGLSRGELVSAGVGAFMGSLLVAMLVVWAARVSTRPVNLPHAATTDHILPP